MVCSIGTLAQIAITKSKYNRSGKATYWMFD